VYASSVGELFRIDPETLEATSVGAYRIGSTAANIAEIAMSSTGRLVGIDTDAVTAVEIDPATAICTTIVSLPSTFAGFGFAPPGLAAPAETLLASSYGELFALDLGDGTTSPIGSFGSYSIRGDFTALDGVLYGSMLDASGNGILTTIDPTDASVTELGPIGQSNVLGLANDGTTVYGITEAGEILLLDASGAVARRGSAGTRLVDGAP
jgi:hypothetical protein